MISVWKKTNFGGCPEARIKYKTQSLFTVLACPRKYSQALLLRCTRLPAVGQLPSSCPAHQSCPWICPLCGTAPGRPRAYAVCRTACMSAQTTAGQQKRKSDINANIPKWEKFRVQISLKQSHFLFCFFTLVLRERKMKSIAWLKLLCNTDFPLLKFRTYIHEKTKHSNITTSKGFLNHLRLSNIMKWHGYSFF